MKKSKGLSGLLKRLSQPRYRGRHVVVIKDKIFTAQTGKAASKLFKKLTQQYPSESPLLTYVPREEALILILA